MLIFLGRMNSAYLTLAQKQLTPTTLERFIFAPAPVDVEVDWLVVVARTSKRAPCDYAIEIKNWRMKNKGMV
jgi:hypothetical protein